MQDMEFHRILVPLDRSPESNVALPVAHTIAAATGASVVLLHVLDLPWPEVTTDDEFAIQAMEWLAQLSAEFTASRIHVESVVRRAPAAEEVVRQVNAQHADLVIMRTHGLAGVERAVMGSVAESVLSQTSVPVVLIGPAGRPLNRFQTILVPVDGTSVGSLALSSAVGLARGNNVHIHLLQLVVPVREQAWTQYEGITHFDPAWDEQALARAHTYIDGLLTTLHAAGVEATGEARFAADIPAAIVATAQATRADAIAMSTHALTGLPRALLGSVSDVVLRSADCPVLLIHRPRSQYPSAQVASFRASGA